MITAAQLYEHWSDPGEEKPALRHPHYYKGWLIGTNGHGLVAIRVKDRMVPIGASFRTAELLRPMDRPIVREILEPFAEPHATSLEELRRFAGDPLWGGPHRFDHYNEDHVKILRRGYLYGKPLNLVYLARALDGVEGDRVQVDASGALENPIRIRDMRGRWIAVVMGMRPIQGPWDEAPHYPAVKVVVA